MTTKEVAAWFTGRLPDDWFTGPAEVDVDREEILVVGELADVELDGGAGDEAKAAARSARATRFREDTREARMRIAEEAQHRFGRKVSWGVSIGASRYLFTTVSVPVMTRLRQRERAVLDTLVASGVARSRSDALAWCVRLVGQHEEEWIGRLRSAVEEVTRVRAEGPR
jgi:hypothetical protein